MAKKPSFPNRPCPKCGKPIHIKAKRHEACGWVADEVAARKTAPAAKAASAAAKNGETTGAYFRRVFKENRAWLKGRSNDEILKRWLADHPGHKEVPGNIKAHLSNVKSMMRSKKRKKVAKRAEHSQPSQATLAVARVATPVARRPLGSSKLDQLELQIDDCLILARQMDQEGLHDVIGLLRKARNEVVWKMGQ
jgi:hypothetical protein